MTNEERALLLYMFADGDAAATFEFSAQCPFWAAPAATVVQIIYVLRRI
ncbi:hypothetical protein [Ruegeria atlantica]|nr:hypothetical protein [Ruegeria atlantica]